MSEKVLVVDDERDIANLLEVYLQNENYVVYKYYCAKDAIPCIRIRQMLSTDFLIWCWDMVSSFYCPALSV